MFKKISRNLFLTMMFIFLYFPIFYLIIYSFNSGDTMVSFDGFSLKWYRELLHNKDILIIILNTVIVALISALIASIIGTLGAIAIYQTKNKQKQNILYSLNSVLIISPDVIIGISFLLLFTVFAIPFGFMSVCLAHIAFSIPVVVIMILPKLNQLNGNIIYAAKDLGASEYQVFSRILLPLIKPGLIIGFFTAFTYSLDDFAVTFFVTGNGFTTLAVNIYSSARIGISLEINALSTIIFVITFVMAILYYIFEIRGGKSKYVKNN